MAASAISKDCKRDSRHGGEFSTPGMLARLARGWNRQRVEIERWAGPYGWATVLLVPAAVAMLIWLSGGFPA